MRGVRWKRGEGSSAGHTVSTRPNQTQNLSMIGDGATLPSGRALRSPVSHRPEPPFTQAHAASQTGQRVSLGRAAARPVEPASDQRRPARSTGARVPARPMASVGRAVNCSASNMYGRAGTRAAEAFTWARGEPTDGSRSTRNVTHCSLSGN